MKNKFLRTILLATTLAACITGCYSEAEPTVNTGQRRDTYLVLVNKDNELPANWQQKVQIYEVENSSGKKVYVEGEASEQFQQLQGELLAEGIQIEPEDAFRTDDEQQEVYDEYVQKYGTESAEKYTDLPEYSEHCTGLAIDISIIRNGTEIQNTDEETIAEISDVLPEYGFILRYPKGKEEITGHRYEPWHLRYVGDTEIARKIMQENLTLEDYLENPQ